LTSDGRPVPVPDASSQPFWDAAAEHRLVLARCARCDSLCHPPDAACPQCGSPDPEFSYVPVEGDGAIRSWTVIRQSFLQGFDVPFVLVDVELAVQPGLRLIGRLLDGPEAPLGLGIPVRLAFEDIAPGVAVPAFALEAS
jgi:hypothetical protein